MKLPDTMATLLCLENPLLGMLPAFSIDMYTPLIEPDEV
jgi:hypothetical protein